nr:NADP-dependent oxidoreductase [Liquorilactobacillus satsumensis]
MKAAIIQQYGTADQLEVVANIPTPTIQADEVLVENYAISINPIDYKARQGLMQHLFKWQFPVILGWDLAGKVVAIGSAVTNFKVGDAVFARPDIDPPRGKNGSYAEYTAVKADKLALKPQNISYAAASAVPLAGQTALQMLRKLEIKSGQKVLIQAGGAGGGVGMYAIQLAKQAGGAHVVTTASQANHDFVISLGADQVIDYHKNNIQDVLTDFDAVLDTVGDVAGGISILKKGGRFLTIAASLSKEQQHSPGKVVMSGWVAPNSQDLTTLANYIANRKIKIVLDSTFPFTTAGMRAAHIRSETHHARGKIVVQIKN